MSRGLLLIIAASVVGAATASAQGGCPSCVDSVTGEWHMLPAAGLRVGIPQRISAALGIVGGRNSRESEHTKDATIYVEPGWSAGRATIGYLTGFGNMGSGFGFGATAMRTWKTPWLVRTNQTYLGGEAWLWPIFFSGPRVGLFREMTGPKHGWFFTADFGFGL